MNNNKKKYALIMHDWNMYVVPAESLASRPKLRDYGDSGTTDEMCRRLSDADDRWIAQIEHYYARPELLEFWNFKHGRGVQDVPGVAKVDTDDLIMGRDFDVTKMDTIHHCKIAHGAKTQEFKNYPCAIPVQIKSKEEPK